MQCENLFCTSFHFCMLCVCVRTLHAYIIRFYSFICTVQSTFFYSAWASCNRNEKITLGGRLYYAVSRGFIDSIELKRLAKEMKMVLCNSCIYQLLPMNLNPVSTWGREIVSAAGILWKLSSPFPNELFEVLNVRTKQDKIHNIVRSALKIKPILFCAEKANKGSLVVLV